MNMIPGRGETDCTRVCATYPFNLLCSPVSEVTVCTCFIRQYLHTLHCATHVLLNVTVCSQSTAGGVAVRRGGVPVPGGGVAVPRSAVVVPRTECGVPVSSWRRCCPQGSVLQSSRSGVSVPVGGETWRSSPLQ